MRFNIIATLLFTFTLFSAKAQQDAQFSDYKLNMSSFNPAFAGFFDGSVLLIHRTQFAGFDGAPETQNLNINIPIDLNMGAGFNVTNQKLGVTQDIVITGDYSYTIYTDELNMLSFGLKAGLSILDIDYSRLDLNNADDLSFQNNIENQLTPRVGVGLLFNTPNWFIGLSTPNFIKESYNPTIKTSTITSMPQIYFTTGYQTRINDDLLFKPSILAKAVENAPLAIDFALNFEFREKFRFGASYRWNSAITGMMGINLLQDFQAGYAYDYNINGLGKYAPSSHQFYIKYIFKQSKNIRRECSCSFTDPTNNLGF